MKKDKFKKMRLQIQTLDTVRRAENCVLLLESIEMEMPEVVNIFMESTEQSRLMQEDGTLVIELAARGIRSDDGAVKHGKKVDLTDRVSVLSLDQLAA